METMNTTQTTPEQPRMTGMTFHGVLPEHISARVTHHDYFSCVTISLGRHADITLFTNTVDEAYGIMNKLSNFTVKLPVQDSSNELVSN